MVRDVTRPDLLMLAAVLHDIGKVAGRARPLGRRAPRSPTRCSGGWASPTPTATSCVRLVREHLTLIELATRRDPEDPATIVASRRCRRRVGRDPRPAARADRGRRLRRRPEAWTDWRAGLVARLSTSPVRTDATAGTGRGPAETPEPVDATASPASPRGAARGRHRLGGPTGSTSSTGTGAACSPTPPGCWPPTASSVRSAILRTVEGVAVNEWGSTRRAASPAGRRRDLRAACAALADGDRGAAAALAARRSPRDGERSPASGLARRTGPWWAARRPTRDGGRGARPRDRVGLLRNRHDLRPGVASRASARIATYAGQTLDTFYVTEFGGRRLPPARVAQAVPQSSSSRRASAVARDGSVSSG